MKDLAYVVATAVFFLLSWLYVRACERVWGKRVDLEYLIGMLLSVLLCVYLVYALLKPERF